MSGAPLTVTDPGDFGRVAVLMGGQSAEREISLESGRAVLTALRDRGVDASGVDVGSDIVSVLGGVECDRVFVALHGRGGEDGVIQGALETLGVPYTGSGVLGSALGMDKFRSKLLWRGAGLPTPDFVVLRGADSIAEAEALGFPLIVKPAREGSSLGMAKVHAADELEAAWRAASGFDSLVMAERWIDGSEYTAGVLERTALPLIRLETPRSFYDYEAKYRSDSTRYLCPCGLDEAVESGIQRLALAAFDTVGAFGWGRVDLMRDQDGQPWLIEVNTVPGMTDHSLVPMAARASGIEFEELVWRILQTSMRSRGDGN